MRQIPILYALVFLTAAAPALAQPLKFVPPGKEVPTQGNSHIEKPESPHVPYNSTPPTSGPHVHYIATWGVSKTPIADEVQVHNLEDGGVMIQYKCNPAADGKACADLVASLEKLTEKYKKIIVAPYPRMKSAVALTAWGRIDTLDRFDEARIERFVHAYMGIDHHPRP